MMGCYKKITFELMIVQQFNIYLNPVFDSVYFPRCKGYYKNLHNYTWWQEFWILFIGTEEAFDLH